MNCWRRSHRCSTVPLIEISDLVIAKVLAGRPKDVDDARAICRAHAARLDAGRIRRTLRLLEEALTRSDLLTAFDEIAATPRR